MTVINRDRLAELVARERALYVQQHPRSAAHYYDARNLFGRVPMTWMNKWPGGFPLLQVHAAIASQMWTAASTSTLHWATRAPWQAIHRQRPWRRCGRAGNTGQVIQIN